MWDHIFSGPLFFDIPQKAYPKAIIIPHHDITTDNQNAFYSALCNPTENYPKFNPSVIVLISPDHFELGNSLITLPKEAIFTSPEGNLNIDQELIAKLINSKQIKEIASYNDKAFVTEHGIFAHSPFIKHYFPNAKVVPILVKMFSSDDEYMQIQKLGDVLSKLLPKDSLVIGSVDFSHYQTPKMTNIHDNVAKNTIQNMEDPRFIEVDSPETLGILFEYCKKKNATNPFLIHNSSTYDYIQKDDVVSTSHQFWTFYDDTVKAHISFYYNILNVRNKQEFFPVNQGKNQTILIAGSGKTEAGIRTRWKWDRYQNSKDKSEIYLRDLAGTEARFLHGFDALIFDPKLGEKYERTLHNTKLSVEVISQNEFNKKYKEFSGDFLLSIQNVQKSSDVKVLEVLYEENQKINEEKIKSCFSEYDLIVFRDNHAKRDCFAYLLDNNNHIVSYNLGIISGKKRFKGSLLVVEFSKNGKKITTFDYTSKNAKPPKINQFAVE